MKLFYRIIVLALLGLIATRAETLHFHDDFQGPWPGGWSWVREHREGWRVTPRGLEIKVEPGNMWGSANDARNILVRPVPDSDSGEVVLSAQLANRPTAQYEQIDLVWYYDDSHMVKIGLEQVDGQLSLVMGREEKDRTRTLAIIAVQSNSIQVRLRVRDRVIRGEFRTAADAEWRQAGECDLPGEGKAQASLQAYQGPISEEHWARVSEFRITRNE